VLLLLFAAAAADDIFVVVFVAAAVALMELKCLLPDGGMTSISCLVMARLSN